MARKIYRLIIPDSDWLNFTYFSGIQMQDSVSLEIKKKIGSSINLDIHHSFSSDDKILDDSATYLFAL